MRPTAVALVAVVAVLVAAGGAALLAGPRSSAPAPAIAGVPTVAPGTPASTPSPPPSPNAASRPTTLPNPPGTIAQTLAPGNGDTILLQDETVLAAGQLLATPFVDVRACPRFTLFLQESVPIQRAGGTIEVLSSPDGQTDVGLIARLPGAATSAEAGNSSPSVVLSAPVADGGQQLTVQPLAPYVRVLVSGTSRPIALRKILLYCTP